MKFKVPTIRMLFALAAMAPVGDAVARSCELRIEGNDAIQFSTKELVVEADCTEVELVLVHTGKLPVEQMGHNWTLTRTADWQAVAQAGQGAGLESDYLPPGDERIIVHTDMVGGGEQTSVSFDVSMLEKGGDYTFFCSFPGHWALMNGKLVVK